MRARLSSMVRFTLVCALALVLVSAVGVVGQASPGATGVATATASRDTGRLPYLTPFVSSATVRLVSGDLVRLQTRADGSVVSTVLPGSPHAGGPLARWRVGANTFVLPHISPAARRKLDLSLFDVTALETYGDRVPVTIRFKTGTTAARLPGVRLDRLSTRATPRGLVLDGSYGRSFRGLSTEALANVASVRLAAPPTTSPPALRSDAATHTVTVNVHDVDDEPVPTVIVTLLNVQDGAIVQDDTNNAGRARFDDLPAGPYSVVAFDFFDHLLVAPEFDVTTDHTVVLDTGDATVKPEVILPGHRVVDSALGLTRTSDDDNAFALPFSFTGPRFRMRVQPATADVAHGALAVGVSATLAPKGSGTAPDRLAITADVMEGVPGNLTFDHHRRDFAKVVQRLYANGPSGLRQSFFGAFGLTDGAFVELFSGRDFSTRVPGRRTVLFQANRSASYQQTVLPLATPSDSDDISQLIWAGRFLRPGREQLIDFAHGPVGPGYRGHVVPGLDAIKRARGRLVGSIPLFSGSGHGPQFSHADSQNGEWSLRSEGELLARGRGDVRLRTAVPAGERTYTLTATSQPDSPNWTLSTLVRDEWTFRSGGDHPGAPLLTPRYAPPVSLGGVMPSGPTSFRLAIHSLTETEQPIARARLQLSTDDGRTWRDARLTRLSPTSFRVAYRNPSAAHGRRFVSIRIVAQDTRGDRVVETAMRVYRLR